MTVNNRIGWFAGFLVLYETACWLAMDAYTPALPSIMNSFDVGFRAVQLTIALWMAGGLLPQIVIGPCSDHFGRKPVLLVGAGLFIVTSFACAFAQSFPQFVIARFFQGMVIPTMIIAGYAAVHELCNQQQAIQLIARMQSVTLLAPSIGPLLGGVILFYTSWHWIFIGLGVWTIVITIGLKTVMPESLPVEQRSSQLNIIQSFKQYRFCINNRIFMFYTLAICGLLAIIVIWISASPLLIIGHFHYSTLQFGISQAVVFAAFIIGTKLIGYLSKQHTQYHLATRYGSLIVVIGGFTCLISSLIFRDQLLAIIISLTILMLGSGICFSVFMRLAIDSSSETMGIKMGLISFFETLTATLSSIVVIVFYHNTTLSLAVLIVISSLIPIFTIPFLARLQAH